MPHLTRPVAPLLLGLALLCAALPQTGCVAHRIYNETPAEYLRQLPLGDHDDPTNQTADLAFIEFDDQGQFWNINQLNDTLTLIKQRNAEAQRGVLVIVFVHGWKNNANLDRGKGNAVEFRDSITQIATRQLQEGAPHPDRVVGVYLGWRGATTRVPLVEQLTFWDRRIAADRMGSHAMRETIYQLGESAKQRDTSKIILVGHSMGGQIVGNAMSDALTTVLLGETDGGVPVLADLIMLLNPARDGLAAAQLVDFLKRRNTTLEVTDAAGDRRPAPGPLMVSITSEADGATRVVYPLGRTVATALAAFQPQTNPNLPGQRYLVTHTEGHVNELVSHRAYLDGDGEVILESIPGAYNDTPYWIVRVTADICASHSDLDNPNLNRLVDRLYTLNGAYDTDLRTSIVTGPAAASPSR